MAKSILEPLITENFVTAHAIKLMFCTKLTGCTCSLAFHQHGIFAIVGVVAVRAAPSNTNERVGILEVGQF